MSFRLIYCGPKLPWWVQVKTWLWLRRTTRIIKKELEDSGWKKL